MSVTKMIKDRMLPEIPANRDEIIRILASEEYGILPPPAEISFETVMTDPRMCAGSVDYYKIMLRVKPVEGEFSFPVYCAIPKKNRPCPAFIHINFRDEVPDKYMPTEEITDSGFAVLSFCYKDVTSDDGNFSDGLAGLFTGGKPRKNDGAGKIAYWAWAAMRVLDYALTLDSIDKSRISVVGHSRLGKTALLAGGMDTRFYCAFSNDSGCSGAAVSRGKNGESIKDITERFPYWFCENYKKYSGNEYGAPFDQHFLLALCAPRLVYVASAAEDDWANPLSEYLCCVEAGKVYEKAGVAGFVYADRAPQAGDIFHAGSIGYHLREGVHYLSRFDWQRYMEFIRSKEA